MHVFHHKIIYFIDLRMRIYNPGKICARCKHIKYAKKKNCLFKTSGIMKLLYTAQGLSYTCFELYCYFQVTHDPVSS